MKVTVKRSPVRNVTLRLSSRLMENIDDLAAKYKISRQALISAILAKALSDKHFEITVQKNLEAEDENSP